MSRSQIITKSKTITFANALTKELTEKIAINLKNAVAAKTK